MNDTRGVRPSPDGGPQRTAARDGRTYYERAGIRITDQYLTAAGRRYTLADLRNTTMVRGPYSPVVTSVTVVAAVVVLAVAVAWPWRGFLGICALAVLSLIPVAVVVAVCKVCKRHYQLWSDYRGIQVRVLDVPNGETFGQICRALTRARESRQRTSDAKERLQKARAAAAATAARNQRSSSAARLMRVEESSGLSAFRRIASNASR